MSHTNRFDARRDGNEKEIVEVFERMGLSVYRLDQPLDLLIGYDKRNYLVEVKMPGKNLNDNQVEFVANWKGQFIIIRTIEQAIKFAHEIRKITKRGQKSQMNTHGLDSHYFNKKLKCMVRDIECYTPDEMFNELSRLMMVAAMQAGIKATIKVKFISKKSKEA